MRRKQRDPWVSFRREVLHILRGLLKAPVMKGETVAIETVTGARIEGTVSEASILGITLDTHGGRKSVAAYIPCNALDVMDIEPMHAVPIERHDDEQTDPIPDDQDPPEPDPDMPPEDDEGAPDAAVVR